MINKYFLVNWIINVWESNYPIKSKFLISLFFVEYQTNLMEKKMIYS